MDVNFTHNRVVSASTKNSGGSAPLDKKARARDLHAELPGGLLKKASTEFMFCAEL
jgi:hypothetical protein